MMKIECPKCGASGQIDETRRPAGSTSVRCPRCQHLIPFPVQNAAAATPLATVVPLPAAATRAATADSPPGSAAGAMTPPAPQFVCSQCDGSFPRAEVVRFGEKWVCAGCKPDYVQRLKQGMPQAGEMNYAGFWLRTAAKFLDGIILTLVLMALTFPLSLMLQGAEENPARMLALVGLQFVVQIAFPLFYTVYFLGKHRATPGKMACGLVVVRSDGNGLSYGRAAGRHFAEWLSSLILGIGYLMVAVDEEKRSLHDRICDTRVVRK